MTRSLEEATPAPSELLLLMSKFPFIEMTGLKEWILKPNTDDKNSMHFDTVIEKNKHE